MLALAVLALAAMTQLLVASCARSGPEAPGIELETDTELVEEENADGSTSPHRVERTALQFQAPANLAGLPDAAMFSFGPAWGYLNGDDWPDLYVPHHYGHGALGLVDLLLINDGQGAFRSANRPALRLDQRFPRDQHAAVWAAFWSRDLNALDLYQSVGGRRGDESKRSEIEYVLLANEGGDLFNRAAQAGVQALLRSGPLLRGRIALPLDFDRSGGTDLLLTGAGSPLRLLRWNGAGFEDATAATGLASIRSRGDHGWRGTVADLDGNGFDDLILPGGPGRGLVVYANQQGARFVRRDELSKGFGRVAAVFPMNGGDDRFVDLVVLPVAVNRDTPLRIVVNEGEWRFRIVAVANELLAWGSVEVNAGDMDNDGDFDLVVVTRRRLHLLENRRRDGFLDVTDASGLDAIFNRDQPGRFGCVAIADYDLDGRLDLVGVRGRGGPSRRADTQPGHLLVAQNVGSTGGFLRARLVGRRSDPAALGSVVAVADGTGEKRFHQMTSGVVATCQNDPALHLGIGSAEVVEVEVSWPSGVATQHSGLEPGQIMTFTEPDASAADGVGPTGQPGAPQ